VLSLLGIEDNLAQRVVGQDAALVAVANAVRRSRAGLGDQNRPIGSFFFMGPTGVGKTETARALAEFLFDDERAMIRIDMSE
jgi:ATP-dependent Clp protease ATP-binding subunit ClpB